MFTAVSHFTYVHVQLEDECSYYPGECLLIIVFYFTFNIINFIATDIITIV